MKSARFLFLVFILVLQAYPAKAQAARNAIMFFYDGAREGFQQDIIDTLNTNPALKLAVAFPDDFAPGEQAKKLAQEGRIEPVLTLDNEPILPLLYDTNISTPVSVQFSWPQDIRFIIAKNIERFTAATGFTPKTLYLRSGIFSGELIEDLKKLGFESVIIRESGSLAQGGYEKDNFLVFAGSARAGQSALSVVITDRRDVANETLKSLSQTVRFKAIQMVLPGVSGRDIPGIIRDVEPPVSFEPDLSVWYQNSLYWIRLAQARSMIEDYKNSGKARIATLDSLREELFPLYSFEFLARFQKFPTQADEQMFDARLSNVYKLLNRAQPSISGETPSITPAAGVLLNYQAESRDSSLQFLNAVSSGAVFAVKGLSVSLNDQLITYKVDFLGTPSTGTFFVDIYMDLNNQRGAGMTSLLPDLKEYMEPRSAWEYAIRIDKRQASLYRSGEQGPALISSLETKGDFTVNVSSKALRGNPLNWGYQVVAAGPTGKSGKLGILDFIYKDPDARKEILNSTVIQLPALRPGAKN
jgi:hypothetical protein